jgi:hypothetical protein
MSRQRTQDRQRPRAKLSPSAQQKVRAELGDAPLAAWLSIELLRQVALIQDASDTRGNKRARRERQSEARIAAAAKAFAAAAKAFAAALQSHPRQTRASKNFCAQLRCEVIGPLSPLRSPPQAKLLRPPSARDTLLNGLMDLWQSSGRKLTASISRRRGGPLIRFLMACSDDLFDLSPEAARKRIKIYRRESQK